MPRIVPDKLKPYLFHGLDLTWKEGDSQAYGDCPLCEREGKFSVKIESSEFKCFKCGEAGNSLVFLRWLWDTSDRLTKDYSEVISQRRLLNEDALMNWQVCRSTLSNEWIVPGFNTEGKLIQLYKYAKTSNRMSLLPTPTMGHGLHGVNVFDPGKEVVFLCEGIWDGLILWESLRVAKNGEEGLVHTSNPNSSLLSECNVLATPSANVFFEGWLSLFSNKLVNLCLDNDHPKETAKGKVDGAGLGGTKRIVTMLLNAKVPPLQINWIQWAPEGFSSKLESGYDVGDLLNA